MCAVVGSNACDKNSTSKFKITIFDRHLTVFIKNGFKLKIAAQTPTKSQVKPNNVNIINCFTTRKSHESDVSAAKIDGQFSECLWKRGSPYLCKKIL